MSPITRQPLGAPPGGHALLGIWGEAAHPEAPGNSPGGGGERSRASCTPPLLHPNPFVALSLAVSCEGGYLLVTVIPA